MPLRPEAGRHVAARNGGRSRDARHPGGARHQVHDSRSASGAPVPARSATPNWIDVSGGRIDPTRAYDCTTPSGKKIAIFFYDGPISRAVAFEGLLNNGEVFARAPAERVFRRSRLGRSWRISPPTAKATAIITVMARWRLPMRCITSKRTSLAQAHQLRRVSRKVPAHARSRDIREHRMELRARRRPLERELRLQLRRPRRWNQEWRAPLRQALDWLRDEVAPLYEERMRTLSSTTPGRRATTTSRWCWTVRPKCAKPSCSAIANAS